MVMRTGPLSSRTVCGESGPIHIVEDGAKARQARTEGVGIASDVPAQHDDGDERGWKEKARIHVDELSPESEGCRRAGAPSCADGGYGDFLGSKERVHPSQAVPKGNQQKDPGKGRDVQQID